MIFDENYTTRDGIAIPKLALGTWLMENEEAAKSVKAAIEMGYRHIDTAQAYGNEQGVAQGVRLSGVPRETLFLTSKVAAEHKSYREAADSIDATLEKMGMDYMDMMLIHSPQPWAEVNQSDNRYFEENKEVWRAMEDAHKAGKVRVIGVSNFLEEDIENLLTDSVVSPMVNQILAHVTNTPFSLIDHCKEKDILVEAYSPIAHGEVLKNREVADMAKKYHVSTAQLCLKYDLQLGMIVLPKTTNPDHMRSNAQLDFVISDADMQHLKNLERIQDYGDSSFFPVYGGKM